ncbi:homoserine kinase [Paenibacillus sp. 7884-2]|nr:homoserine kinase [Paenibacillus sp. 7884-2]
MPILTDEQAVLADLTATCSHLFGFTLLKAEPIKRGWLNLKWKITTDSGVFLLKQYNKERFKKYNQEDLLFAFEQQTRLFAHGLPCPNLYTYRGSSFLKSAKGEHFLLMDYYDGKILPSGSLTKHQLYDLGRLTGKMHCILNDGSLRRASRAQFIPPSIKERLAHWEDTKKRAITTGKEHLLPLFEAQATATETVCLEALHTNDTGWAHRDLWVDNVLFKRNDVAAILDFDRLKYDYPQLDVARAILSGALGREGLNTDFALAFLDGYKEYHTVKQGFLAKSLLLLWYMESIWWVHPKMDEEEGPPRRFQLEMAWLAENLQHLGERLEGR